MADSGLRIVDIANPAAPREVGYYDTPGAGEGVTVAGTYAYVADGYSGLRIVDIANPTAPHEVGYYNTPGYALGVTVAGTYAYVAHGDSGLRIVDIANPTAPQSRWVTMIRRATQEGSQSLAHTPMSPMGQAG